MQEGKMRVFLFLLNFIRLVHHKPFDSIKWNTNVTLGFNETFKKIISVTYKMRDDGDCTR